MKYIGTDRNSFDIDGDLLLDGFEYVNKMSPKQRNSQSIDIDSDGLTNLKRNLKHRST